MYTRQPWILGPPSSWIRVSGISPRAGPEGGYSPHTAGTALTRPGKLVRLPAPPSNGRGTPQGPCRPTCQPWELLTGTSPGPSWVMALRSFWNICVLLEATTPLQAGSCSKLYPKARTFYVQFPEHASQLQPVFSRHRSSGSVGKKGRQFFREGENFPPYLAGAARWDLGTVRQN